MDNSIPPTSTSMQQSAFTAYNSLSKRSTVVDDILDPPPRISSSNSTTLTSSIYGQSRRPPSSSSSSARSGSEGVISAMSAPSASNSYGAIGDRRRSSVRLPPTRQTSSPVNLSHELDRSSSSISTAMGEGGMQHVPSIVRSLCMSPNLDESYARLNPSLYPLSTSDLDGGLMAPLATVSEDVSSSVAPNVVPGGTSGGTSSLPPSTSDSSISAEGSSFTSSSNGGHSSLVSHGINFSSNTSSHFRDSPPNFLHPQYSHPHVRQTSASSTNSTAATTPLLDLDSPVGMSPPGGINVVCYTPKEEDGPASGDGQLVADYFSGLERMMKGGQKVVVQGYSSRGGAAGGGTMQYGDGSRKPSLPGGYEGLGLNIGSGTGEFGFGFGGMGGTIHGALGGEAQAAFATKPLIALDGTTPTQGSISAQQRHQHHYGQHHQHLQDSLRTPTAHTSTSSTSTSDPASKIAELQSQIEELKLKQAILDQQKAHLIIASAGGQLQQQQASAFRTLPIQLPPPPLLSARRSASIPPSPTYYSLQSLQQPLSQYGSPYGSASIGLTPSSLYHHAPAPLPSPSAYGGSLGTRATASTTMMGLGTGYLPLHSAAPSTKPLPDAPSTTTTATVTAAGSASGQQQGTRSRNVSAGKGRNGEAALGVGREGEGGDNVGSGGGAGNGAKSTGGVVEPINFISLLQPTSEPPYRQLVFRIVRNMDQQASIFIQQKLKSCSSSSPQDVAERRRILDAILSFGFEMMTNRFGNWAFQRCLEEPCTTEEKRRVAMAMRGRVVDLATNCYGTHVVQKALECDEEIKRLVLHELLNGDPAVTLINKHASHVWSRIMELTWSPPAPPIFAYVNSALRGRWVELATHETGSLVVQHLFENCVEDDTKDCLEEIFQGFPIVVKDQWGSFVIQHMLEHGLPEHRSRALSLLGSSLLQYATDPQAIKSVDKALKVCPEEAAEVFVTRLCEPGKTGRRPLLVDLALNNNGSQFITQLAPMASPEQRRRLDAALKKHVVTLKGNKSGSRIVWMFERMRPGTGGNGAIVPASPSE